MESSQSFGLKTYFGVYVALMLLLALTFGLGQLHLGYWNTVLAMTISVAKMLLVLLYFMHLRKSPGLNRIAAAAGGFWLAILFALALSDLLARGQ